MVDAVLEEVAVVQRAGRSGPGLWRIAGDFQERYLEEQSVGSKSHVQIGCLHLPKLAGVELADKCVN